MRTMSRVLLALIVLLGVDGRSQPKPLAASDASPLDLVGEWRAQLQFTSGAFAPVKDLEFMYAFNQGGTMTESSNYDASPPVPPAYGIWRKVGTKEFEAIRKMAEQIATRLPICEFHLVDGAGHYSLPIRHTHEILADLMR